MQLAWKEEKRLENCWSEALGWSYLFPAQQPRPGGYPGLLFGGFGIGSRGCSHPLLGVQNGGQRMFAYTFPTPAVTEALSACGDVLSLVSAWLACGEARHVFVPSGIYMGVLVFFTSDFHVF